MPERSDLEGADLTPYHRRLTYSMSVTELVNRPIITDKYSEEWMNKMTDEEYKIWEEETSLILESEGVERTFPSWNAAFLSKSVDMSVMYKIFNDSK